MYNTYSRIIFSPIRPSCVKFVYGGRLVVSNNQQYVVVSNHLTKRGVNRGMQIRRSVVFLGPIRRSDLIFVQIRIRVTLKIFRGIQKVALQHEKMNYLTQLFSNRNRCGTSCLIRFRYSFKTLSIKDRAIMFLPTIQI